MSGIRRILMVSEAMYVGAVDWDAVEEESRAATQVELDNEGP